MPSWRRRRKSLLEHHARPITKPDCAGQNPPGRSRKPSAPFTKPFGSSRNLPGRRWKASARFAKPPGRLRELPGRLRELPGRAREPSSASSELQIGKMGLRFLGFRPSAGSGWASAPSGKLQFWGGRLPRTHLRLRARPGKLRRRPGSPKFAPTRLSLNASGVRMRDGTLLLFVRTSLRDSCRSMSRCHSPSRSRALSTLAPRHDRVRAECRQR